MKKTQYKTILGLLLGLSAFAVLVGLAAWFLLGQSSPQGAPLDPESQSQPVQDGPAKGLALSGALQGVMLDGPEYMLLSGGSTPDGFYYIESRPEDMYAGNIRYVDFASRQDIYLSGLVNSDHASDTDPSYIDSIVGWHTMFCAGDKLYFLRGGASSELDADLPQDLFGALYQMELDGSGRTCLYQADAAGSLEPDALCDDESIYLFERGMDGVSVVQVPIAGGAAQKVLLPGFSQLKHCQGSSIYYLKLDTDTEEMQLVCFDLASLTTTVLDIPTDGSFVFTPQHIYSFGSMYLAADPQRMRTAEIYTLQGEFVQSLDLSPVIPANSWGLSQPRLIGGKMIWDCWNDESKAYYSAVLDVDTQQLSKTLIPCQFDKNGEQQPAEIIAQAGSQFLIVHRRAARQVSVPNPDGTTANFTTERYELALIPQEDYFAGITANMQFITAE